MAPAGPLQLGTRLVRRRRPGQLPARAARPGRRGRYRHRPLLRHHGPPIRPSGLLAPRVGRAPPRPAAGAPRQPGRAVGGDARRHQAGGRDRPDLHHDHAGRTGRPRRTGGHPARGGRRRTGGPLRRDLRRLDADRGRRPAGRLGAVRRIPRRADGVRPTGVLAGRRPAVLLLHLRHHLAAEDGDAHPPQLSRRPPLRDVLERRAPGRPPPERLRAGLGQARLELVLRPVERRGHGRRPGGPASRPGHRPGRAPDAGDQHALRAADGVARHGAAGAGRPARASAGGHRRRGVAGAHAVPRRAAGLGPVRPGRLRPDRDDRPDRQPPGPGGHPGPDGVGPAGVRAGAARPGDRPRGGRRHPG